jgi:hypothetical protein
MTSVNNKTVRDVRGIDLDLVHSYVQHFRRGLKREHELKFDNGTSQLQTIMWRVLESRQTLGACHSYSCMAISFSLACPFVARLITFMFVSVRSPPCTSLASIFQQRVIHLPVGIIWQDVPTFILFCFPRVDNQLVVNGRVGKVITKTRRYKQDAFSCFLCEHRTNQPRSDVV